MGMELTFAALLTAQHANSPSFLREFLRRMKWGAPIPHYDSWKAQEFKTEQARPSSMQALLLLLRTPHTLVCFLKFSRSPLLLCVFIFIVCFFQIADTWVFSPQCEHFCFLIGG